ncbi:MAG TPA: hypothetical protein VHO03_12745 [Ignavibacteriales bacterium]|nr:hypothetical protein [Ignavibacteriales bacterium]
MPYENVDLMTAAILIVLIYFFIRYMIIYVGKHGYVSVFHLLFLVYNFSLVFKLINLILELQKGILYYQFTSLFDVLLGILFCFFSEEDKLFSVKLAGPEAGKSVS